MGNLVIRNGVIQFDFRYQGLRCRESSRLPDTATNRRHCEAALKKIEAEITLGHFDYARYFPESTRLIKLDEISAAQVAAAAATPTFAEFSALWYGEKEVEWRRSYRTTITHTLANHLVPRFGHLPVSSIDKPMILKMRVDLSKTIARAKSNRMMSPDRINHIMTPLRMILIEAADRFGFACPWQNIKPLKVKRTEVEPFSIAEVMTILKTVRADYHAYYLVRFFTGMRTAEVNGLQWKYVDFERRQIYVREAFVKGRMEDTKTDGSNRTIEMSPPVEQALRNHFGETAHRSEFVFCTRNNTPLDHNNVTRKVWDPLLRHLKLKRRRPYETRHTAATLWMAAGENPEWIARQMGHTTTEMLFRVYSRFVPNLTRRDGSAFDAMMTTHFSDNSTGEDAGPETGDLIQMEEAAEDYDDDDED